MSSLTELKTQKSNAISARDAIQAKIDRLEAVKESVSETKHDLKPVIKQTKELKNQTYWDGGEFRKYRNNMESNFSPCLDKYFNGVDALLDRICDKITSLKSELADQKGLIGWFEKQINNLINSVEKATN